MLCTVIWSCDFSCIKERGSAIKITLAARWRFVAMVLTLRNDSFEQCNLLDGRAKGNYHMIVKRMNLLVIQTEEVSSYYLLLWFGCKPVFYSFIVYVCVMFNCSMCVWLLKFQCAMNLVCSLLEFFQFFLSPKVPHFFSFTIWYSRYSIHIWSSSYKSYSKELPNNINYNNGRCTRSIENSFVWNWQRMLRQTQDTLDSIQLASHLLTTQMIRWQT